MGLFIMPLRDQGQPYVDDYVLWSTETDLPVRRGRRAEIERVLLANGTLRYEVNRLFGYAEQTGTSATHWAGDWGSWLVVDIAFPGPAMLPRTWLKRFCDTYFRRAWTRRARRQQAADLAAMVLPVRQD